MTMLLPESQRVSAISELQKLRLLYEADTAQGDDITYGLEKDRTRLKQELEMGNEERSSLKAEVAGLKSALEKEQQQKLQLVLLLVNDRKKVATLYMEEKRRTDELARILRDEKNKVQVGSRRRRVIALRFHGTALIFQRISMELEEESKRSLAMETEVEKCLRQLSVQRDETKAMLMGESTVLDGSIPMMAKHYVLVNRGEQTVPRARGGAETISPGFGPPPQAAGRGTSGRDEPSVVGNAAATAAAADPTRATGLVHHGRRRHLWYGSTHSSDIGYQSVHTFRVLHCSNGHQTDRPIQAASEC